MQTIPTGVVTLPLTPFHARRLAGIRAGVANLQQQIAQMQAIENELLSAIVATQYDPSLFTRHAVQWNATELMLTPPAATPAAPTLVVDPPDTEAEEQPTQSPQLAESPSQ